MDAQPTAGAVTDDSPTRPGEPARPNATAAAPGAPADAAQAAPTVAEPGVAVAGPGAPLVSPGPAPWPDGSVPPGGHVPSGPGSWPGAYVPAAPSAPRSLVRRLSVPVGILAGVAAAFAYVGTVDPNEPGHYPVCPLLRFTGLYCPGCGGLRSAHAVAHGDLPTALGSNALAVVGYGIFAVVMVVWLIRAVRGVPMRLAVSPVWWWGIGAVLALFTLVRNLPFGAALAP
ncbi:DUF2752 domain-containing protein [Streptomyces vietnamensis]|uniref:DUF2752 domain-containing protein n=1 Tax=Streptomyces vietnamensis TaxID=362257 RepID=UPI003798EA0F